MANKKQYKITKVRRVMKLEENGFQPATYIVWKVTGPRQLRKYFVTKKDATAWVNAWTSNKIA